MIEKGIAYIDSIIPNPALSGLAIFFIFLVAAWTISFLFKRILLRITRHTKFTLDDKIVATIRWPVFISIIIYGLYEGVKFSHLSEKALLYATATLTTLVVLVWTFTVLRIIRVVVEETMKKVAAREHQSKDIIPLLENVGKVLAVLVCFLLILAIWEVDITPFLASAGLAGVAVAFAAKETLANLFGGISIFFDRPFKIRDYVLLETGERGEVVEIGIRSTRIKTRDDILITIPNSIMANTKITNESAPRKKLRIRIPVGVAYGSDIEKVEAVLTEVAADNNMVTTEPEPRARFRRFGDSALEFELLCWGKQPAEKGLLIHQLNKTIYHRFRQENITIPFPQRDVHIYSKEKNPTTE